MPFEVKSEVNFRDKLQDKLQDKLMDSTTRIVPKYDEYVDYPEPDLDMMQFVVTCQHQSIGCANDTLSSAAKVVIIESLAERDDVEITIQLPRIGKQTTKSYTQRVLKSSTYLHNPKQQ